MSETLASPPPCTECGACCYGDGPRYVRVSGADYERLGVDAVPMTQFLGNRCHLLLVERRCIALSGSYEEQRCACTVYATRPEPCRTLERGSAECYAVIEREQMRALTQIQH